MDYVVKAKKEMTEEGRRRAGKKAENIENVFAKFAYLTDTKLPETGSKKTKVKAVQRELKKQGIKLDPNKFDLEKKEELMVQPTPIIGPRNRRTFRESIFEDTWATVKIPAPVRRRWEKENKDIIKARKQNVRGDR